MEGAEPALPVSQESWYEAPCVPWHPFRHGQRSWEAALDAGDDNATGGSVAGTDGLQHSVESLEK